MMRRFLRDHLGLVFVAQAVLLAIFDLRYHEFWRDEASPVLVARALPWSSFWLQMRIEGIPFLFHAALKVISFLLAPKLALILMGAVGFATLLFGTYRLLLAISKNELASVGLTLLLSLTYVFSYEVGVVIRTYALGLGLAFLCMAQLRAALETKDRRAAMWGAAFGALSALTSAHSACIAGGVLLAFALCGLTRRGGLRLILPTALALPALFLTYWVARPFAGRTVEYNDHRTRSIVDMGKLGLQGIVSGLAPSDWWFVDSLPELRSHAALIADLRSISVSLLLFGALIGLVLRLKNIRGQARVQIFDLLAFMIGWIPLTIIVALHYWGSYRHHLFFALPAIVVLSGFAIQSPQEGRITRLWRRSWLVFALPWLVFQIGIAVASYTLDVARPFSDTKAFALILPPRAHVVSEADWSTVGLLLWRPDLDLSAANGNGRHFRFLTTDRAWHVTARIPPMIQSECKVSPDRVFFVGQRPTGVGPLVRCVSSVSVPSPASLDRPQSWENISMWRIDCECALSIKDHPSGDGEDDREDPRR